MSQPHTYNRVIVVAPMRAICEGIHTVLTLDKDIETVLMTKAKVQLDHAISRLFHQEGFGVVAGTGTGKTVAIKEFCAQVLRAPLKTGIVTREHEVSSKTHQCNVLVITPGIFLKWVQHGQITSSDLIIADEVHQTSAPMEFALSLALVLGCTFVWLSATVDPDTFATYLNSKTVITCDAYDEDLQAEVEVHNTTVENFLLDHLDEIVRERRGCAVFVPSRAACKALAEKFAGKQGLQTGYYNAGEPIENLTPFLKGEQEPPFALFMTEAGASSLNIPHLNLVVIDDGMHTEVVHNGRSRRVFQQLDNNRILQMSGRVNGRARNGKVYILSKHRPEGKFDLSSLKPEAPAFKLGSDLEQLALVAARANVDARTLPLPGKFDHDAYNRTVLRFIQRGLLAPNQAGTPVLTKLGDQIERLPVSAAWGETLVEARQQPDSPVFRAAVIASCVDALYGLTKGQWDRASVLVPDSDHLTAYNIVAAALRGFGSIVTEKSGQKHQRYTFRGDNVSSQGTGKDRQVTLGEFRQWCEDHGFNGKEIKNILSGVTSLLQEFNQHLPQPSAFLESTPDLAAQFADLLARVQSLDYVHDGFSSEFGQVSLVRGSAIQRATSVLGSVSHWNDGRGNLRASIEGTTIPLALRQKHTRLVQYPDYVTATGDIVLRQAWQFAGQTMPSAGPSAVAVPLTQVPPDLYDMAQALWVRWNADQQESAKTRTTSKPTGDKKKKKAAPKAPKPPKPGHSLLALAEKYR